MDESITSSLKSQSLGFDPAPKEAAHVCLAGRMG